MTKKRKRIVADFETTNNAEDCRVWLWGMVEMGKLNFNYGKTLDEFMSTILDKGIDIEFHNLKFDGSFILPWLLKKGYKRVVDFTGEDKEFKCIISNKMEWYMIDILKEGANNKKHVMITDSLKSLPFSVKVIGEDYGFNVLKGEIDYNKERPVGYEPDENEIRYVQNDCEIVARARMSQIEMGMDGMTIGSSSMRVYKKKLSELTKSAKTFDALFPSPTIEEDKDIRKAFKGGFTWANPFYQERNDIGAGRTYDVNSMYPYIMRHLPLPFGKPLKFNGEYKEDKAYPLYIQKVTFGFEIKEGMIPCISSRGTHLRTENEYLDYSGAELLTMFVSGQDWEMIQEHYNVFCVSYEGGYKYKARTGMFNEFIDMYMDIKMNSEGAIKMNAKLMMNNLYGKFATNPDMTGKIPFLDDYEELQFKDEDENLADPKYPALSVFVTSYGRQITIGAGQAVGLEKLLYCDTDSIHVLGDSEPTILRDKIDSKKLGYWKHESTFTRGKYLRQKMYVEDVCYKEVEGELVECNTDDMETTILNVKCSGLPSDMKDLITFENFNKGLRLKGVKKSIIVKGGSIVSESTFEIAH